MKKAKILLAMILMTTLIISAGISAFATTVASGPDPNRSVSLTIRHNIGADGVVTPGDPTGSVDPRPVGSPVVGSSWQIRRVNVPNDASWDGAVGDIVEGWLGNPSATEVTDADGRAVFSNLQQGIYLVEELPSEGREPTAPFLVSLPFRWNDEWVYDVHVFPKEPTQPVFEKDFTSKTLVEENLIITWSFSLDIRLGLDTIAPIEGITPNTYIRIIDRLDPRLSLVPNSVSIEFDTADGTSPLTTGWEIRNNQQANSFFIDIYEAGRDQIAAYGSVGGFIRVTFQTEANIEDIGDLGTIENEGTLRYSNNPEYEIGKRPYTTVFGLELTKVNTGGTLLPGAVFHLYADTDVSNGSINSGATPLMVRTTNEDGFASFYGLPAGTFYLYEHEAPAGYRRLTTPMQVVISPDMNSPYLVNVSVTNSSDFELPVTGGMGTLLFTIIGLVLIGGSIFAIILYRRKKSGQ